MNLESKGLKPPKKDRRDFSLHKGRKKGLLGAASPAIPMEGLKRLRPSKIRNQGATNLCTGFVATSMRTQKYNRDFDPGYFCMQENAVQREKTWGGASLRTQAQVLRGMGVLPDELKQVDWQKDGEFAAVDPKRWPGLIALEPVSKQYKVKSAWTCDGPFDTFDNIRLALYQEDLAALGASAGIQWFPYDWNNVPSGILKMPVVSQAWVGHNIRIYDWTLIDGIPYLVFENSEGDEWGDKGIGYISREIANKYIFTSEGPYVFLDYDPNDAKDKLWGIAEILANIVAKLKNFFK